MGQRAVLAGKRKGAVLLCVQIWHSDAPTRAPCLLLFQENGRPFPADTHNLHPQSLFDAPGSKNARGSEQGQNASNRPLLR